jgi:hypothetical protein
MGCVALILPGARPFQCWGQGVKWGPQFPGLYAIDLDCVPSAGRLYKIKKLTVLLSTVHGWARVGQ